MSLTFTPRTGVSLMHGRSVAGTLRALRLLELGSDLDLDIVVGVRADDPDRSALADGIRGRGVLLPVDPVGPAGTAANSALAGMVDKGHEYAWIISSELVVGQWTLGLLTKHMALVPDCAVVGPRIMQDAQPKPRIWSDGGVLTPEGVVRPSSAGMSQSKAPKARAADVDAVHRIGALYRMSAIETVGTFVEGDEVEGHDVGWCDRARRAGWRVMVERRSKAVLEGAGDG